MTIDEIKDAITLRLREVEEAEAHHKRNYERDEAAYNRSRTEENLKKMLQHEGGHSQYIGGWNQGQAKAFQFALELIEKL